MKSNRSLFHALVGIVLLSIGAGCAPGAYTPSKRPAKAQGGRGHDASPVRVAQAFPASSTPDATPREPLAWETFSPEVFARAKAERKFVVLDGSAEWCHWCHVMEATTYHDPAVRKILDAHFIAIKVDVDTRPDIEERYGDYGWPATVLFSPDATEIGKYRGYIAPEKFAEILTEVVAQGRSSATTVEARAATGADKTGAPKKALTEEHVAWIERFTELELDRYWDDDEGGWGALQKAPLGWNNAWLLRHAEAGDQTARAKVLFTLDKQSALIDPVWGGIYQYSAASDWASPHFEKLMTFQAPALDNYATAYRLTGAARHLTRAQAMLDYLERFMKSPEGGFYATQDADLNAHDRSKPFMDGHAYYGLDEKKRLAAGIPRIDTHEYGRENGLAISAYCTMYEATKNAAVLATAEKAARRILATHSLPGLGGITHDAIDPSKKPKQRYLSDNAAFGFALVRLYEVTRRAEWLEHARALADFSISPELADPRTGGLFASTRDPDAVGVFAARRVPFEENVMALRMLAHLSRALPPARTLPYRTAIDRVVRAISTPEQIKSRGRMLGDYLLALEESEGLRGGP